MAFVLDEFVATCKSVSNPEDESKSIEALVQVMTSTMRNAQQVRDAIPNAGEDEILLHEDDSCTIYIVRVPVGVILPPHDHGMAAIIGVFEGTEVNQACRTPGTLCNLPQFPTITSSYPLTLNRQPYIFISIPTHIFSYDLHPARDRVRVRVRNRIRARARGRGRHTGYMYTGSGH